MLSLGKTVNFEQMGMVLGASCIHPSVAAMFPQWASSNVQGGSGFRGGSTKKSAAPAVAVRQRSSKRPTALMAAHARERELRLSEAEIALDQDETSKRS